MKSGLNWSFTNQDLVRKNAEIRFYHTLSHELKPADFVARVHLHRDGRPGWPADETQTEYLAIAKESWQSVGACINDMLDATRLETGQAGARVKARLSGPLIQRVLASMAPPPPRKKSSSATRSKPDLPEVPWTSIE